ncbi:hypothetical protein [Salinimicrobium sediminilitoris]|uniref:hypothetical protein n=1 Tax=Salinimicrobium sediminilitoris TaxID=2876715 RepID=UPI001E5A61E7|nr:hypothetical protein [Salinimicrobium sediminilitoris]MCC8358899.1 hypothetical protein [Salinimicrobium sediminilitoris]
MKKILIILFLVLFLSCSSKENLEGTWIGAYSYSTNSDSKKMPTRILITFEKDKYFAKSFKYDYRSESDFEKGTYEYNRDTIFYNSDQTNTALLEIISKDSLVMKGLEGANNTVYKRLEDSLKSKSDNINLKGKRFLRTSLNYSDTLNFTNDSIIIKSWENNRTLEIHWERISHNGFEILFLDLDIPYIIRKGRDGTIKLTGLHKNRYELELRELK